MKKIDSFRFNWLIRYFLLITGLSITLGTPVAYILEESNRPNLFILFIIILFGLFIFSVSRSRFDIFEDHFDFVNFGFHKRVFFKEIENCIIHKNLVIFNLYNGQTQQVNNSYENFTKIAHFIKGQFSITNLHSAEEKRNLSSEIEKFKQTYLPDGLLNIKASRTIIIKESIISALFILLFIAVSLFSIEFHPARAPKYGILLITIPSGAYFVYRIFYLLSLKVRFNTEGVLLKGILREKIYSYRELLEPNSNINVPRVFSSESQEILNDFSQILCGKVPINQPVMDPKKKFGNNTFRLEYSKKFKIGAISGIVAVILFFTVLSIIGAVTNDYEMCKITGFIAATISLFSYFNNSLSLTQTLYHDRIEINKKGKITTYLYTEFRYLKKTQLHGRFFLTFKDLTRSDIALLNVTDDALQFIKQFLPFVNDSQNSISEIEESKELCVKNSQVFHSTEQLVKVSQRWLGLFVIYFFIGGFGFSLIGIALMAKFGINGIAPFGLIYATSILFDTLFVLKSWKFRELSEYPKLNNPATLLPSVIAIRLLLFISATESHFCFSYLHLGGVTILLLTLFYLIFRKQFNYIHKKTSRIVYSYTALSLFLLATIISINFFLDFSMPTKLKVTVVGRETKESKKDHNHYLTFEELGTTKKYRLKASCREYRYVKIGEEAVLYQKPGALGIPWIYDFKILSFD